MWDFIKAILPFGDGGAMATGAIISSLLTFLFGEAQAPLIWLIVFMVADWATGLTVSIKRRSVSSRKGFLGLTRKGMILAVVALAHGLDVSCSFDLIGISIETIVIGAYALNEAFSIMENCNRLGVPLPAQIVRVLELAKSKQERRIDNALEAIGEKEDR